MAKRNIYINLFNYFVFISYLCRARHFIEVAHGKVNKIDKVSIVINFKSQQE